MKHKNQPRPIRVRSVRKSDPDPKEIAEALIQIAKNMSQEERLAREVARKERIYRKAINDVAHPDMDDKVA